MPTVSKRNNIFLEICKIKYLTFGSALKNCEKKTSCSTFHSAIFISSDRGPTVVALFLLTRCPLAYNTQGSQDSIVARAQVMRALRHAAYSQSSSPVDPAVSSGLVATNNDGHISDSFREQTSATSPTNPSSAATSSPNNNRVVDLFASTSNLLMLTKSRFCQA